ncbi:MAG TPA: hypothetical protein VFN35_10775 [Ktedonobacteraceae bacterium]|nr:hypothetical protein [Ktedonobacteraceae bacterium]
MGLAADRETRLESFTVVIPQVRAYVQCQRRSDLPGLEKGRDASCL